ncbi:MAG: peptidoglycan DD-metalloendopeptidase family protein [Pseudomonadota bacterium]
MYLARAAILGLSAAALAASASSGIAQETKNTAIIERQERINEGTPALQQIVRERSLSLQRAEELEAEINAIKRDRTAITNALIQAAKTERQLTDEVVAIEGRVGDLTVQVDDIRVSLRERRALFAEVLAALQRMGLNPPPALLVKPDDALSSVRSSILLAAVVPEMRTQTRILLQDINDLADLRASLEAEQISLEARRIKQEEEQVRLELLASERRALEDRTLDELAEEQRRAAQLAAEAENLQRLIERLQAEIDEERRAQELARKAAEDARRAAEAEAERKRLEALQAEREEERRRAELAAQAARQRAQALRRAEELEASRPRLQSNTPFPQLVGQLSRPVGGTFITRFGERDGLGSISNGETIDTRVGAIVTAPADGTVLYAGPFRAYGQLLILDAGEAHHVVLAGMAELDVSAGNQVLTGEPVGRMGAVRLASVSAAALQTDNPKLYVEFRRNGRPIDPKPWWSR